MKSSAANFFTVLGIVAMAAIGGAGVVFSEYDDSPGGELIGLLFIVGTVVLGMRARQPRRP